MEPLLKLYTSRLINVVVKVMQIDALLLFIRVPIVTECELFVLPALFYSCFSDFVRRQFCHLATLDTGNNA